MKHRIVAEKAIQMLLAGNQLLFTVLFLSLVLSACNNDQDIALQGNLAIEEDQNTDLNNRTNLVYQDSIYSIIFTDNEYRVCRIDPVSMNYEVLYSSEKPIYDLTLNGDELYIVNTYDMQEGSEYLEKGFCEIDLNSNEVKNPDSKFVKLIYSQEKTVDHFYWVGDRSFVTDWDPGLYEQSERDLYEINDDGLKLIAKNVSLVKTTESKLYYALDDESIIYEYDVDEGIMNDYSITGIDLNKAYCLEILQDKFLIEDDEAIYVLDKDSLIVDARMSKTMDEFEPLKAYLEKGCKHQESFYFPSRSGVFRINLEEKSMEKILEVHADRVVIVDDALYLDQSGEYRLIEQIKY